jgi:hypothetical protein
MDKVVFNEAREPKRKQKKVGRLKKAANTLTLEEQTTLRDVKRQTKATFHAKRSPIARTITLVEWVTL